MMTGGSSGRWVPPS